VRVAAGLAVAGAVLGTLLDALHVATSTTRYAHPAALGLAWWVPILFAAAALVIGLSHRAVDALLGRRPPADPARIAVGLVALLGLWATSGLVKDVRIATPLLAAASLAVWWRLEGTLAGLGLGLATAAAGVAVETSLVRAGAFEYVAPDAGRVASWLPWLYVTASVAVGNLARWLASASEPNFPVVRDGSRVPRG
jgi:hypothetical protein